MGTHTHTHTHTHSQDLLDDKSDWDHTLEKVKFLNKLVSDMPIPLEVFDSDVVLLKQGPLNQVLGNKKEVPRFCFLFNKFIAVAEKANDTQFRLVEVSFPPLVCTGCVQGAVSVPVQVRGFFMEVMVDCSFCVLYRELASC